MHGSLKKKVKAKRVKFTQPELEDVLRYLRAKARTDFWTYRQLIRPNFIPGWWQHHCSTHLQQFYERLVTGKRPKMVMEAPPQHGKSMMVVDFISWIEGRNPDLKSMYTSYSDDLGLRANSDLQRIFSSVNYKQIFPHTRVNDFKGSGLKYKLNSDLIEFIGREGTFRNTTVLGQITGQGFDFGTIDDPVKGRKEARSETVRNSTWNWLTDDFFTRFSERAGMLMIMTRWHRDDPAGRFIAKYEGEVVVVRFPAVAIKDEEYRRKGEALFPEHKSLDFLLERKGLLTRASWEALYQQNPIVEGGGVFPITKFRIVPTFNPKDVIASVRYWDKAGTEDGGAYTCGVLMHKLNDGTFVIPDVRRGQWSASEREKRIMQTAELDEPKCSPQIYVEQEPGSGGKESAENTIRMLAGYRIAADKVTGAKEDRAEPYAAQQQQGNIALVAGDWVQRFMDEHESWPNDKYMDQVDAAAGAFNKLTLGSTYDTTFSWL